MIESLEKIVEISQKRKELSLSGQLNLFGQTLELNITNGSSDKDEEKTEYLLKELQQMEKELTGFYITSHPLENLPEIVRQITTCNLSEIHEIGDGTDILVTAVISNINKKLTRNNKLLGILQLEDTIGKAEAIIFSESLAQFGEFLIPENTILLLAKVQQKSEGDVTLQVKSILPLEELKVTYIELPDELTKNNDIYTTIHSLRGILQQEKESPFYPIVLIQSQNNKDTYLIDKRFWVEPTKNLLDNINKVFPKLKLQVISPFKSTQPSMPLHIH